jgi:uncharacterized protein YdiU (UPF0061 family)
MDAFDFGQVFSSIDHAGRYAFGNQPRIALWNLTRLAETLLPLLADDQEAAIAAAQPILSGYAARFEAAWLGGLARKVGIDAVRETDEALVQDLLQRMQANEADFTLTFRALCDAAAGSAGDEAVRALFRDPASYDEWALAWRARLAEEAVSPEQRRAAMRATNPAFIPRNHQVERVIAAAVERDDIAPFEALLAVLSRPFEDQPDATGYALPPQPEERVLQTFCGT